MSDTPENYEELAIDLLGKAGYQPEEKDHRGLPICEYVQDDLSELLIRAPKLAVLFENLVNSPKYPYLVGEPPLSIRAFNIWQGATFIHPDQPNKALWVVKAVRHYSDEEQVLVICRHLVDIGDSKTRRFLFDFNDKLPVIGSVVNATDHNDSDCGTL